MKVIAFITEHRVIPRVLDHVGGRRGGVAGRLSSRRERQSRPGPGLFMDRALLEERGLHPVVIGPAVLADHRIHIGERATLLPCPSSRAHGGGLSLCR